MADELEFIEQGLQRSQIDEFFAEELARAGYGGWNSRRRRWACRSS